MRLTVQKYGGSSLSTIEKINLVAQKVVETRRQAYGVVVVVSAMGDSTDNLLNLARQIAPAPSLRELDMLLATGETVSTALVTMAIRSLGEQAIALSGAQCGIITNDVHSNARILEVHPQRIKQELDLGAIVVVPGFQGMSRQQEITTLGRGGSDTTAVALAAALNAERCLIYTDVEGIYSADPRHVPEAVRLDEVGAKEMQELAWHGAQVLKAEAVEFANNNGVSVVVRSTFKDDPGTLVYPEPGAEVYRPKRASAAGVSGRKDLIRITIRAGAQTEFKRRGLFSTIAKYDLIFGTAGGADVPGDLFISNLEIPDPYTFAEGIESQFDGAITVLGDLGAVSIVGFGLGSRPARLLDAIEALEEIQVPLIKSFSGRESFTFVIPSSRVDESVTRMHQVFVDRDRSPLNQMATSPGSTSPLLLSERTEIL
ncbi:MAG: aspartate kinase [Blastocatellia bacterium]